MKASKKQVILVDHNEKTQAVEGIEEAEIVEIIDHHRLGNMETVGPVYFRNQPVGCTATIITQMYDEEDVEITPQIAGLLCAAIVSDTLMFRSPTCTSLDEKTARKLARIADVDIEEMATEMFSAGSSLKGKSAKDICYQDFKQFTVNDIVFGVGQINSMNKDELSEIKQMMTEYLPNIISKDGIQMVYFMMTNIIEETSEIICIGDDSRMYLSSAYNIGKNTDEIKLKGVVSRKKQLIPALVEAMKQHNQNN
jgi:manganese-dependent inorganic pyrophosphatase